MNEYLCRSYVAEKIITEMTTTRMKRRIGLPANSSIKTGKAKNEFSVSNALLEDEGSDNYKNWLAR